MVFGQNFEKLETKNMFSNSLRSSTCKSECRCSTSE